MATRSAKQLIPPAVLLGGEAIAVSLARCLASAGIFVCALGEASVDPVRHSRSCGTFVHVGSGDGVQTRYFEWLAETRGPSRVVFPCNDDALELIARRRDDLLELGCITIEANDELVLAMLDKERTYELARQVGIAAPVTRPVRNWDDVQSAADEIGYPFALKPHHSHLFAHRFGMQTKLLFIKDRQGLERAFDQLAPLDLEMMATEVVPGPVGQVSTYTAYLDEEGTPLVDFTRRKIRQYPPHFGRGSYYVMEPNPRVAELGLHFFRAIGLHGLASVEFKPDARDGQLKLIECNYRFDGAIGLSRAAGLDLGCFTHERLLGGRPSVPPFRREGVRLLSLIDDCRSSFILWREGELGLVEWARSLLHRQHFQVFSWRDPFPSVIGVTRVVGRMFRRNGQRAANAVRA